MVARAITVTSRSREMKLSASILSALVPRKEGTALAHQPTWQHPVSNIREEIRQGLLGTVPHFTKSSKAEELRLRNEHVSRRARAPKSHALRDSNCFNRCEALQVQIPVPVKMVPAMTGIPVLKHGRQNIVHVKQREHVGELRDPMESKKVNGKASGRPTAVPIISTKSVTQAKRKILVRPISPGRVTDISVSSDPKPPNVVAHVLGLQNVPEIRSS